MKNQTEGPVIGAQLDLGRQKETLEFIGGFIDFIAANGFNTLYLHLESGIRVPSFSFAREDKSYSPDEIRRIVNRAGEKGIVVVPIIATLGHAEHFLVHKELEHLSEQREKASSGREFCPSLSGTYEFLFRFITEVSELFESDVIHIGCDEVFELASCSLCSERMKNGETYGDIFLKHVEKVRDFVTGTLHKRVMIWDDMIDFVPEILPRLSRDIELVFWEYDTVVDCKRTKFANRKRIDIFRVYDELGFRYHAAPRALNLENISSFARYASKYRPEGLLLTEWEHSCGFMYALYPQIAFAGRVWSDGFAVDRNDIFKDVCRELFGIDDPAFISAVRMFACLNRRHSIGAWYRKKPDECTMEYTASLKLILAVLNSRSANVTVSLGRLILEDITVSVRELLADQECALSVSESLENGVPFFLEEKKTLLHEIYESRLAQWEKIRPGLPHQELDAKFELKSSRIESARKDIAEMSALLEICFFLPDFWGRQNVEISIQAKTHSIFEPVFKGVPKPDGPGELPYYSFYVPLKATGVSAVRFRSWGLNGIGIVSCKVHLKDGGTIVPVKVESVSGRIDEAENLLVDDSRWCMFGNRDGLGHIFDRGIAEEIHELVLKM